MLFSLGQHEVSGRYEGPTRPGPRPRGPGAGPERCRHSIAALPITLRKSDFAKAHTRRPGIALGACSPGQAAGAGDEGKPGSPWRRGRDRS